MPLSQNKINLSVLVSEMETIKLNFEANQNYIGEILNIKIIENELFITHRTGINKSILKFQPDGKFMCEIGEPGQGPGEVMNPRDIIAYDNGYALWDNIGVHKFKKDGKYEKFLFSAKIPGNSFFFYSDHFYFMHELSYPGFLSKYSISGELLDVFKPSDSDSGNLEYSNILSNKDGSFLLVSPLIDTIYSFTEDKLAIRYILDCSPNKSFGRVLAETANLDPLEQLKAINRNTPVTLTSFLENEDYIYLTYRIKNEEMHYVSNKSSKKSIVFSSVINDQNSYPWGIPLIMTHNNWIYIPAPITDIIDNNNATNKQFDPDQLILKFRLKF